MIRDYESGRHPMAFRAWMLGDLGTKSDAEIARIWAGRKAHRNEILDDWYRAGALAEIERRRRLS